MSTGVVNGIARWRYDNDQDVLYITWGKAQPSYVTEVEDVEGMHIRKAISSGEVLGVVIIYYSVQNRDELTAHMPFPFNFDEVVK